MFHFSCLVGNRVLQKLKLSTIGCRLVLVPTPAVTFFRIAMKFADYFREINIGSGSVSMWKNNDGSYFVIEIVRFAEHDKESARQYAALLSGDENYKVDENLHYTLH